MLSVVISMSYPVLCLWDESSIREGKTDLEELENSCLPAPHFQGIQGTGH